MNGTLALNSLRAKKARLAKTIGSTGYKLMITLVVLLFMAVGLLAYANHLRLAYLLVAVAVACLVLALWYKRDLAVLSPEGLGFNERLDATVLTSLDSKTELTAEAIWSRLKTHWQLAFITNHLFLPSEDIGHAIAADAIKPELIWQEAERLADSTGRASIEVMHIGAALMMTSLTLEQQLRRNKLQKSDIAEVLFWLSRNLNLTEQRQSFNGGIGRDWSFGFTNLLYRFGYNISQEVEKGGYFSWLTNSSGVNSIKQAFASGSLAIALIGEDGIGKTSHVYALAQSLLASNSRNYHQIFEIDPSIVVANANRAGYIEQIVNQLLHEAAAAGHIILFLDDAKRFFSEGIGTFDISQILLPVVQSRALPIILAMTPHDYQTFKATKPSLFNLLAPINLNEPNETDIIHILEDTALGLEHANKVLITLPALKEAYRLSGRYEHDLAYPGKAIKLLTQALAQASSGVVDAYAIQQAVEVAYGVKVSSAGASETDTLLNLEARIHERMINQNQAVSVVANAIRRARAGVASPKRPIGSFLFLGPTGVGKTELAKALATTYFGSEENIIRLDMSEYQSPDDVKRLLSDGQNESKSLILAVRQKPASVVLLDEIEKSHANILNLLLQLLDEGNLTDTSGRKVSFKDCIIIATSNAGSTLIRERIESGDTAENLQPLLIEQLMQKGPFKPELLNRFDEIVVFRPLNQNELHQVVELMLNEVNNVLAEQKVSVSLTDAAIAKIVEKGYDKTLGARPMRRAIQESVENVIATKILDGQVVPGDHLTLDAKDLG